MAQAESSHPKHGEKRKGHGVAMPADAVGAPKSILRGHRSAQERSAERHSTNARRHIIQWVQGITDHNVSHRRGKYRVHADVPLSEAGKAALDDIADYHRQRRRERSLSQPHKLEKSASEDVTRRAKRRADLSSVQRVAALRENLVNAHKYSSKAARAKAGQEFAEARQSHRDQLDPEERMQEAKEHLAFRKELFPDDREELKKARKTLKEDKEEAKKASEGLEAT